MYIPDQSVPNGSLSVPIKYQHLFLTPRSILYYWIPTHQSDLQGFILMVSFDPILNKPKIVIRSIILYISVGFSNGGH